MEIAKNNNNIKDNEKDKREGGSSTIHSATALNLPESHLKPEKDAKKATTTYHTHKQQKIKNNKKIQM